MTESGKERSISEAIAERRATPSFDGSSVPDDVLSAILNAGMEAPSGYNLQPWRFIVVRTPDQKKRLREPLWVSRRSRKRVWSLSAAVI
jgi:nitroreductase